MKQWLFILINKYFQRKRYYSSSTVRNAQSICFELEFMGIVPKQKFTRRCVSFSIIFLMRNCSIDIFAQSLLFFSLVFFTLKIYWVNLRIPTKPLFLFWPIHYAHPGSVIISKEYFWRIKSISNGNDYAIDTNKKDVRENFKEL